MINTTDEFWQLVDRSGGPASCWPWIRGRTRAGYGSLLFAGQRIYAHRLAWRLTNGPLAQGQSVHHACAFHPCCNPAHLALTPRTTRRGRYRRGSAHPQAKVVEAQVRWVRAAVRQGIPLMDLAIALGIDIATASRAASGRTWRHVASPLGVRSPRRGPRTRRSGPSRVTVALIASARTPSQIACEVGISGARLHDILLERMLPSEEEAGALATVLGTTVWSLFSRWSLATPTPDRGRWLKTREALNAYRAALLDRIARDDGGIPSEQKDVYEPPQCDEFVEIEGDDESSTQGRKGGPGCASS